MISRRNHEYKSFHALREDIRSSIAVDNAILDGEIVCLSDDGHPQFYELLYRRNEPFFCAFDLLYLNGKDLRELPLHERKRRLREIIPRSTRSRVRFSDHIEGAGRDMFRAACRMDLEGIVAKLKHAPYIADQRRSTWIKIKNPHYTQAEGRHELFEHGAANPAQHFLPTARTRITSQSENNVGFAVLVGVHPTEPQAFYYRPN